MLELGQDPDYRTLSKDEVLLALQTKILEEANEFDPKDPQALKELADILEVIESLASELGADYKKLRAIQLRRRKEMGGFKKRVHIDTLHLQDDDMWVAYYAQYPERFPETHNK